MAVWKDVVLRTHHKIALKAVRKGTSANTEQQGSCYGQETARFVRGRSDGLGSHVARVSESATTGVASTACYLIRHTEYSSGALGISISNTLALLDDSSVYVTISEMFYCTESEEWIL